MPTRLISCLLGLLFLGGCVTSEQLKSPTAKTIETKVNALKENRPALIAYLRATDIRFVSGPVDKGNEICMDKFIRHSGLTPSQLRRASSTVIFSKDTFPFDRPYSLTGTPFISGQVVYDRNGRYLGSYIVSGLTGI